MANFSEKGWLESSRIGWACPYLVQVMKMIQGHTCNFATLLLFFWGRGGLGLVSVPADKREHENKFNKTHKSAVDVETTELVVKVHAWLGCSTDGIHLELKGQLTAFACL